MKIFISYRFTGENTKELEKTLGDICGTLKQIDHDAYCTFWDENIFVKNKMTNKQILCHAFSELDKSNIILIFIKSEDKSEGMLIELGYSLAKNKKIILLIKEGIKTTFVREVADKIIEYKSLEDIKIKLANLKL